MDNVGCYRICMADFQTHLEVFPDIVTMTGFDKSKPYFHFRVLMYTFSWLYFPECWYKYASIFMFFINLPCISTTSDRVFSVSADKFAMLSFPTLGKTAKTAYLSEHLVKSPFSNQKTLYAVVLESEKFGVYGDWKHWEKNNQRRLCTGTGKSILICQR